MNNDAFRSLVNSGAIGKNSSKEIARKAVEEEFRQRRKGGKRGKKRWNDDDDPLSSDDDDGAAKNTNSSKQKKDVDKKSSKEQDGKKKDNGNGGYRDRAKERREGITNIDYDSFNDQQSMAVLRRVDREMSTYLGGDEAHTHLVKGLDIALADKVRREISKGKRSRSDVVDSNAHKDAAPKSKSFYNELTKEEACALIRKKGATSSSLSRDNCRNIVSYFLKNMKTDRSYLKDSLPSVDRSKSRSIRTTSVMDFSADGIKFDPLNAWEVPKETLNKTFDDIGGNKLSFTHLDDAILKQIKEAFLLSARTSVKQAKTVKRNSNNKSQHNKSDAIPAKEEGEKALSVGCNNDLKSDTSDDDIFEDVGDYIPFAEKSDRNNDEKATNIRNFKKDDREKSSIFEGLRMECGKESVITRPLPTQIRTPPVVNVIDRDIIGGTKGSSRDTKVAMTTYEGGYGEEMDVDFDGTLSESDPSPKRKKHK